MAILKKRGKKEGGKNEQTVIKKPRMKARVERLLKKREPLIVENTKKSLFIRGHKTSQFINDTLKDMVR